MLVPVAYCRYNGQLVRLTLLPGGAISAVEISAQPTAYDMKQRHLPSAERFPREELMAEGFCLPLEVTLREWPLLTVFWWFLVVDGVYARSAWHA